MKKYYPIISLLFLAIIFFNGCKEKFECSSNNEVPIPQIMKDYFYYKQGTWWVYKNVKNNTYDSMWVWQRSSNYYQGNGGEGFGRTDKCYERIVMSIDQRGGDSVSKFSMWNLSNFVVNNNNRFGFGVFGRNISTTANWDLDLFFTNIELEKYNPVRQISSVYKESESVQNKNYNNLIEVVGSNQVHYWLFSKHIGLIKYVDLDSNQWELVKYNVSQ
ncbi:MAG: hypothetical protein ACEQSR_05950 [Candidatus Methylacidiphilales bacterium]